MKKVPKEGGNEAGKKVKKIKNDDGKVKKAGEKKEKKVKKPLTGYQMFAKDARAKVVKMNPQAAFGQINQIIGKMWRELESPEKEKYLKMAAEAKEKHNEPDLDMKDEKDKEKIDEKMEEDSNKSIETKDSE